jgi:uncharacterized protein GlcG (DUF336 family)
MSNFETRRHLTHSAVMRMLSAAIIRAEEIKCPQCIVVVDASGELLGEIRMTGSKFLSRKSALAKALTAASIGASGTNIPEPVRTAIGLATGGAVTGLPGGLPVKVGNDLLGGIGVGSGSADQDMDVSKAALSAIGAQIDFD